MMIALPNLDRSFTCTLFWPRGAGSFAALRSPGRDHAATSGSTIPTSRALIPDLVDDYLHNPVGSLATVRCWPWVHHGAG